jgi:hypothetical protein
MHHSEVLIDPNLRFPSFAFSSSTAIAIILDVETSLIDHLVTTETYFW